MNRRSVIDVMRFFVRNAGMTWRMAAPLFQKDKSDGHAWQEILNRLDELESELNKVQWIANNPPRGCVSAWLFRDVNY